MPRIAPRPSLLCVPVVAAMLPQLLFAAPLLAQGVPPQWPTATAVLPVGQSENVAPGDLDGDGHQDLLVVRQGSVQAWLGDGSGAFAGPVVSTLPAGLFGRTTLADLDGDGDLDAVQQYAQIGGGGNGFRVLFADGAGGFTVGGVYITGFASTAVGDFDGDGRPDIVGLQGVPELSLFTPVPVLFRRTPAGDFGPPVPMPFPSGLQWAFLIAPTRMAAVDWNGDAHTDLVLLGLGASVVLFGDGAGGFDGGLELPLGGGVAATFGRIDGDDDLDVVWRTGLVWETNLGNDTGTFPPAISSPPSPPSADRAVLADVDGDGDVDLLSSGFDWVVLQLGDGLGGFAAPVPVGQPGDRDVQLSDVDGDGWVDLITRSPNEVRVYRNSGPGALAGLLRQGAGTAGCDGALGLYGTRVPATGTNSFRLVGTNAPPDGLGVLTLGTSVPGGYEPLGLGFTLHVGFALPIAVLRADGAGIATHPLPIPPLWFLAGLQVGVQSVWLAPTGSGETCSDAWLGLTTSRGLRLTLQ